MIALTRAAAVVALLAGLQPAPAPGFALTLDGDVFRNETFIIRPMTATYANNYWRSSSDPRVNRLSLKSDVSAAGPTIAFGVPARLGTFAFDRSDEDNPNRNPYLRLDLDLDGINAAAARRFDLVHMDIAIAKMDPPGGRIEGTLNGMLEACTPDPNGGGNCSGRVPVRIAGRFSVVRNKDRIVD